MNPPPDPGSRRRVRHPHARREPFRSTGAALAAVLLLLAAGCGDSSTGSEPDPEFTLAEVVQAISAGTAAVSPRTGTPDQDPDAPTPTVQGGMTLIPGGGAGYTVTSNQEFSVVYASVEGQSGYYEIDFGSPRTEADLVFTFNDELARPTYSFRYALGRGQGAGPPVSRAMEVVDVGTGAVQVSVSWDTPSDVDLYVVEPSGEEIFYGNRISDTGGELDLDSNAGCGLPDVRNENITWPDGPPPRGQYTVRVNYWSACNQERTQYVVTVRVAGQPVRTFTGTFTGTGNGGAGGAGTVITTFNY